MTDPAVVSEPIPFRVLLDEAMKLTRRYFGAFFLPVAIPLALLAGVVTAAQVSFMADLMGSGTGFRWTGQSCLMVLGVGLLWLILRGLASGVLTAAAVDGASGRPIDMGAKWRFLLQPATFGTLLLALLAIAVGFCFLIFPGIYIALRMSFLLPVMATENIRGGTAMRRSWDLVRYNPHKRFLDNTATKIFLLYLVAGLIGYAVSFVLQLPFTAIQTVRAARAVTSGGNAVYAPEYWLQVPSAILTSLVSTAIAMYTSFGVVLLYFDVVRRKEGGDLASAIAARFGGGIGTPAPPSGTSPA